MRYAQINGGICVAHLETFAAIDAPNMVLLGEGEPVPLGQQWTGEAWITPPPPPRPIRVTRLDFLRLFTFAEQVRYETEKTKKAALTTEEWADPAPSMDVLLLRAFAIFQNMFDALGEGLLELGHPDTVEAMDVFAALGVFGSDPVVIAARVQAILSNAKP